MTLDDRSACSIALAFVAASLAAGSSGWEPHAEEATADHEGALPLEQRMLIPLIQPLSHGV